jgi:hypothetical protein
MSRASPLPHLFAVAEAARAPDQPTELFRALEHAMHAAIGAPLFTILLKHTDGSSERFWSNRAEYPVGGRKPPNETVWGQKVFRDQQCYLGHDYEAIKAAFFDHELIRSLGCESVLNVPVVWEGTTLGTINLLAEAGHYSEADEPVARAFAALAIPGYLKLTRR